MESKNTDINGRSESELEYPIHVKKLKISDNGISNDSLNGGIRNE